MTASPGANGIVFERVANVFVPVEGFADHMTPSFWCF